VWVIDVELDAFEHVFDLHIGHISSIQIVFALSRLNLQLAQEKIYLTTLVTIIISQASRPDGLFFLFVLSKTMETEALVIPA